MVTAPESKQHGVVVTLAAEDVGLLVVAGALTGRVATTQTPALKSVHQQVGEVMGLAGVVVVITEVAVPDAETQPDAKDASTRDMTLPDEGK